MSTHDQTRPTVPQVLPMVRELYAAPGGGVGCCLHNVLDDGNTSDSHVAFCVTLAREKICGRCVKLGELLQRMSPTQRGKLAKLK